MCYDNICISESMILLDFRNVVVLLSLAVNLILLSIIYRYGRKTPGGNAYAIAVASIAGWILPMVFYRSDFLNQTVLWVRVLYIMASFTSTTFFYFTLVFPEGNKIPWWVHLFIAIENLAIVGLCIHPDWFIRGVEWVVNDEKIILWGPLYIVYAMHVSLFFLAGFVVLWLKINKQQTKETKKQIKMILLGYFIGANLAMVTNLTLPWLGYFKLNWAGQVCSTALAVFSTYAIFKYRLLNIRLILTESFVLVLNLVLFGQFLLSGSVGVFIANGLILAAVMIISYGLIKSSYNEILRREELAELAHNLERANLRLQELDRQKTEFLSIAAHQLRTPLSILKGFIELIKDGAYGKPTKGITDSLNNMNESNEHLIKLVDDFLDISRIEQGRTKYVFESTDLNAIISEAVRELAPKATDKKMKIDYRKHRGPLLVVLDKEKVYNVVYNFVDNAIKYSDIGAIVVDVKLEDSGVAVRVSDTGVGFGREDEANFFQKFYRGKNVIGTNVTGTGLGLYVCRRFIEAHGGKVWAHSPGLGKGSEFGFWIPLSNVAKKVLVEQ